MESRPGNIFLKNLHAKPTRRLIQTPFPVTGRKKPPPLYTFKYDTAVNGWKSTPKETAASRWSKARGAIKFCGLTRKKNTVLDIDVRTLVKNTAIKRSKMQENQGLQQTLKESATIAVPFHKEDARTVDRVWSVPAPVRPSEDRSKQFSWEKPSADRRQLVESAAHHQVVYMKKQLSEKEREVRLVAKQLMRANKDNVTLLRELDGYRGKNYEELFQENIILKQQVDRTSRDNVILSGRVSQTGNRRLLKQS